MRDFSVFRHSIGCGRLFRVHPIIILTVLITFHFPLLTVEAAHPHRHSSIQSTTAQVHADSVPIPGDIKVDPLVYEALQRFHGIDFTGKDGPYHKIGFYLTLLKVVYEAGHFQMQTPSSAAGQFDIEQEPSLYYHDEELYVVVDAVAAPHADGQNLLVELEKRGLESGEVYEHLVSGSMPVGLLDQVLNAPSLRFMRPAFFDTHEGSVTSQGDAAITADVMRASFAVNGTGITVGVLSDSYNCLGTAADDVASGDLPRDVVVLAEDQSCSRNKDEGRALMQIIHDIAPGASPVFHTAYGGQAAFANGILELAADASASVIVDDALYFSEPMFQDGIVAQAVGRVFSEGVAHFSSAGNYGTQSYESTFRPSDKWTDLLASGVLHDFEPGPDVDPYQRVTIPVGASVKFVLQWDQPYASASGGAGSASDLDLMLLTDALQPVASSIDDNVGNDPTEILQYSNPGPSTTFNLAIVHGEGPTPQLIKYIYSNDDVTIAEFATTSSTIFGHNNTRGGAAVGSSFFANSPAFSSHPPTPSAYSSTGPTPILFGADDARIEDVRAKPEFLAPDGVNTTFLGRDTAADTDKFPNFFGTSASAAHAAGVAALLRETDPQLTPAALYAAMQETGYRGETRSASTEPAPGLIQAQDAAEMVTCHDVQLTQYASIPLALPGQAITFTVTLINQGPSTARNIYLNNSISTLLTSVELKPLDASLHTIQASTPHSTTIRLESLEAGASSQWVIAGMVDSSLSQSEFLSNHISVKSPGDIESENNVQQLSIPVQVPVAEFAQHDYLLDDDAITVRLHPPNEYTSAQADLVVQGHANGVLEERLRTRISFANGQSVAAVPMHALDSLRDEPSGMWLLALDNLSGAAPGERTMATLSNPSTNEAEADTDADGHTDADEDVNQNGDLTDDDTDGDGVPDFVDSDDNAAESPGERPAPPPDEAPPPQRPTLTHFLYLPIIE